MSYDLVALYTANDRPYGRTYGNWTVEWWRWILGIPKRMNPVIDTSGEYTNINQNDPYVLFLAGKLAEEKVNIPERHCNVPAHKSILVPVINCESNLLENPQLKTYESIVEHVKSDEDTIVRAQCHLDGKVVPTQRVKSDPLIFELRMVEDNLFNVKGGGTTHASADGYWAFFKPLPKGEHTVSFQGSCEMGRLHSGAIYTINVV